MTAYDDQKNALSRSPNQLVIVKAEACTQTCGTAPCLHVGVPCRNTWATCKYYEAFTEGVREDKYCLNKSPAPLPGEIIRPYVKDISPLPQEILLTESLLVDFKVTITFLDEPDGDYGVDPYRVSPTLRQAPSGTEEVATGGTYWSKWRAVNQHIKNRRVEVYEGFIAPGFSQADYTLRFHGVLESLSVGSDGLVTMKIGGLLKLTDVEYPAKTDGRLSAAGLSATETGSFELEPWTGIDRVASPPVSQYDLTGGDLFINGECVGYDSGTLDLETGITIFSTLTRGKYNNIGFDQAKLHDSDEEVQQAVYMQGNPPDLAHALFNVAGIDDTEIDIAMLQANRDLWFSGWTFAALLHKPTKIKKLIKELREESFSYIWQGADQKIKFKRLAPNAPGDAYRKITNAANIVYNTTSLGDTQANRYTRAVVYYDLLAGEDPDDEDNFRYSVGVANREAEIRHKEISDRKPVFSRWMKKVFGGEILARALASRTVRQYKDGAGQITFGLELKDSDIELGEIVELYSPINVDANGNPLMMRVAVTKLSGINQGRLMATGFDARLLGRFIFIAPAGLPDYDLATEAQREYWYISGGTPSSPGNGDEPYMIS